MPKSYLAMVPGSLSTLGSISEYLERNTAVAKRHSIFQKSSELMSYDTKVEHWGNSVLILRERIGKPKDEDEAKAIESLGVSLVRLAKAWFEYLQQAAHGVYMVCTASPIGFSGFEHRGAQGFFDRSQVSAMNLVLSGAGRIIRDLDDRPWYKEARNLSNGSIPEAKKLERGLNDALVKVREARVFK